jgi:RNA 2',3'-cyclic 3'-phosphodiesterase
MPGRVFVAIELPGPTRDVLAHATEELVAAAPGWAGEKPVAACLLHITLAFIGPVPDAAVDGLVGRLRDTVAGLEPFSLCISGIRAVPSAGRASMVWADITGDVDRAAALAAAVAAQAAPAPERRPFRPHVTLIRARRPRRIDPAAMAAAGDAVSASGKDPDRAVSVRSATVFSSTLGTGGPTYERLAVLDFRTREDGTGPIDIEHVFV